MTPPNGQPLPPAAANTPAAKPTPTPAPTAAPKPAPAPVATFNGSVVFALFSNVSATIQTGEGAAKKSDVIEWEKVEASLKRCEGVTAAQLDEANHRINVTYTGAFPGIDKVRTGLQTSGVQAEVLNPAKVTFRATGNLEDDGKVLTALRGISGVQMVTHEFNDFTLYADLSSVDLDSILTAAQGAGCKGQIVTHEVIKVALTSTSGNASQLLDELGKTKWVLKADIDSSSNSVKVLAIKGRVTRALVKTVMTKCGYPESK